MSDPKPAKRSKRSKPSTFHEPATDVTTHEETMMEDTATTEVPNETSLPTHKCTDYERQRRDDTAHELIKSACKWSAGAGLVPIPFVDMLGVLSVQVGLVRDLARLHNLEFSEHRARTLVGTLAASGIGMTAGKVITRSILGAVPGVRWFSMLAAGPSAGAAATALVGRSFHRHFRTGGTLDNFDVVKHKIDDNLDAMREVAGGKRKPAQTATAD